MFIRIFCMAIGLCLFNSYLLSAQSILQGKITDQKTGVSLTGVSIYVPDLTLGTLSNSDGHYILDKLPARKLLVQVSYIGYQTQVFTIDLHKNQIADVQLQPSVKEMHDVVVTGLSKATERNRTPTSISSLSYATLLQNGGTNIIDAIAKQPGISQITTGSGISKPVIRGLGFNRVVVVNDGIRQEGQQWGDEHGLEIDEFTIHHVEILKGPASLAYGSDALAGVINLLSFPSLPEGTLSGQLITNYQSNNGLLAGSINMGGRKKGISWDLRYSQKENHSYKNATDGYVLNTANREKSMRAQVGINRTWGVAKLGLSIFSQQAGIAEGTRDSITGQFTKEVAVNDSTQTALASTHDFYSYRAQIPYQNINHYKLFCNLSRFIRSNSLKVNLACQQNRRQEYADVMQPNNYGLYFLLNTLHYDIRYEWAEKKHWNVSGGISGMYQVSQNKGIEFLVPGYQLFDAGGFMMARKQWKKLDLSGGIRIDQRHLNALPLWLDSNGVKAQAQSAGATERFQPINRVWYGHSASIGIAYQFSEKVYSKFNISNGFRAPNIAEVGSNGVHEGTLRYESGNALLTPERSVEVDYTFGVQSNHVSFELNLFSNQISHYTYLRKVLSASGNDSLREQLPVFTYKQGDANLTGGELRFDLHPHPIDWLHLENSFACVFARQYKVPDSLQYLPQIPPARWRCELKGESKQWSNSWKQAYISIAFEQYFAQRRVMYAYGTETSTNAYSLWHLGMGISYCRKSKTRCQFLLQINNLSNRVYQDHLNRLKYADTNLLTGRQGISNMGRNVSLKCIVPFTLREKG